MRNAIAAGRRCRAMRLHGSVGRGHDGFWADAGTALSRKRHLSGCHLVVSFLVFCLVACELAAATVPGYTPGELSVTPSGAASYSIPIAVPPGVAGMQPSLALEYNSQGGNGLLGVGWSLSGLSAITRCPTTLEQDGAIDGVDFDANDQFCLDGQRLVAISGTYGANGTEYRTEIDGYSKIVSYGTAGSAPAWFQVWTKSGQVMEYGNSADSRIEASGRADALIWNVNKISDAVGNYLTVSYYEDNAAGEHYLTRIDYAGNNASVRFEYENRTDISVGYLWGGKITASKRLASIDAYHKGGLVRRYQLTYATQDNKSLLSSLKQCDGNGNCFGATQATYYAKATGQLHEQRQYTLGASAGGLIGGAGDFNGDGLTDILTYDAMSSSDSRWNTVTTRQMVHLSNGDGAFTQRQYTLGAWAGGLIGGTGDFNGDGLTDILTYDALGSSDSRWNTLTARQMVHLSNGDGTFTQRQYTLGAWAGGRIGATGDFNGDGLTDILTYDALGSSDSRWNSLTARQMVHLSNGDGTFTQRQYTLGAWAGGLIGGTGDFNGDGLADILSYDAMGSSDSRWNSLTARQIVHLSNGDGTFTQRQYTLGALAGGLIGGTGDFNGDGLTDILTYDAMGSSDSRWNTLTDRQMVHLSNGDGTFTQRQYTLGAWAGGRIGATGDFNGDGLTDILTYDALGSSDSRWNSLTARQMMHLSNGDGTFTQRQYTLGAWAGGLIGETGDFNGDGLTDVLTYDALGSSDSRWNTLTDRQMVHATIQQHAGLLLSVTDGLGAQTTLTYHPLTNPSVYTKQRPTTAKPAYPEQFIQAPMYVVSEVKTDDGLGGQNATTYKYGELKAHLKGRGMLGFAYMEATNQQTGIKTRTDYRQDFPYTGLVSRTEQRHPDGSLLGETANTFAERSSYSGKVHFPYVSKSVDKSYELNTALISNTVTEYSYDNWYNGTENFGNPTRVTVTVCDADDCNSAGEVNAKDTVNQYHAPNLAKWHLDRLSSATVTHTSKINGSVVSTVTRSSAFDYNANGLLSRERIEPGNSALELITDYGYDAYGNKTTVTVSGAGVVARTTTTTYDVLGQFPISVKNALNQTETRTYDARFGVMTRLTGPNGLSTTWQYDGFGRQTRETRADGTWSAVSRGICGDGFGACPAGAPARTRLYMTTESSGAAPVSEYSDQLGRKLRSHGIGFDGRAVYSDTEYNALGQVARISRPYFAGDTAYWTRYEYDLIGRPIKEASPTVGDPNALNGQDEVLRTYEGLSVTEVNSSYYQGQHVYRETTRINNLQGKLAEVLDEEGAYTVYDYDATGNLLKTQTSKGSSMVVLSQMSYDKRGRKTAMLDADMGSWSYGYNAFGELVTQTDAKGQIVTMQYDKLGRMISRDEPEGLTSWTYDSAANGIGKLAEVSGPNGYRQVHRYDGLGRPSGTDTTIAGITYNSSGSYDSFGRVSQSAGPNGFKTVNIYNPYGHLLQVREENAAGTAADQAAAIVALRAEAAALRTQAAQLSSENSALAARPATYQALARQIDPGVGSLSHAELLVQAEQALVQGCLGDLDAELYRILERSARDTRTSYLGRAGFLRNPLVLIPYEGIDIPIKVPATAAQLAEAGSLETQATTLDGMAGQYGTRVQQLDPGVTSLAYADVLMRLYAADLAGCGNAALYQVIGQMGAQYPPTAVIAQNQAQIDSLTAQAVQKEADANSTEQSLDATSRKFWQAEEVDASGNVTRFKLGNGLETVRGFDAAQGYVTEILTGGNAAVQHLAYKFDNLGNLRERRDENQALYETFTYDGLNRLTGATANGVTRSYAYDTLGNITHKGGVGDYLYGQNGAGPHAVTTAGSETYRYDANGNMTEGGGRVISWSSFNKPLLITKGTASARFEYDADHNRIRQLSTDSAGVTSTITYLGKGYERIDRPGYTEHKHYLSVPGATVVYTYRPSGVSDTRYLHLDHLGSTDVITDENGAVVTGSRQSFDAWGARRSAANWIDAVPGQQVAAFIAITTRGYTGHEQLDHVGLVHMNGRVYDAMLGRFLSADPHVQSPANPQSLNRYTYVNNNPLSYTDPSGYFFKKLFKSVKKAVKKLLKNEVIRFAVAAIAGYYTGMWAYNTFMSGQITSGALSSAFTAATAKAVYVAANVIGYSVGGAVAGGIMTGSWEGALRGAVIGGISGGISSYIGFSSAYENATGALADVGHQVMNQIARREVAKFAQRKGWSEYSVDLTLIALSFAGNKVVGGRLQVNDKETGMPTVHGVLSRLDDPDALLDHGKFPIANRIVGLPFDAVDVVLGYQGLPTATWVDIYRANLFGKVMAGHSLGTLDASNLAGLGLVSKVHLYSLPFGNISPSNSRLTIGAFDVVNGGFLGKVLNPTASVETQNNGVAGHRLSCYLADPC